MQMLTFALAQSSTDAFSGPDPLQTATVDSVLAPYIYIFFAAFIVAWLFTPLMQQVAIYYRVIDQPDANRKMHKEPIAYLGGAAVFLGWMAGLATSQFVQAHRADASVPHVHLPVCIVIGGAMIIALGLWDDLKKVNPWFKILVQIGAAGVLLYGGIGTQSTAPLAAPIINRLERTSYALDPNVIHYLILVSSCMLTIALVVGNCNATNLMDGLDGLCGGVSALISFGLVFLAVHMATIGHVGSTNAEGMRIVLGLALLGALLGFVPYNFNPASIFLGDTGSMFIGFAFATMMTMMAEVRSKWFLAAVVMFALPVLDTALAFVRRWVNKRPIFSADRHHVHHQLLARGFTIKQTVFISYGLTVGFVVMGGAIVFARTRYVVAFYMVIFGWIVVAAYKSGLVHERKRVGVIKGFEVTESVQAIPFETGGAALEVQSPGVLTAPAEIPAILPKRDGAAELQV